MLVIYLILLILALPGIVALGTCLSSAGINLGHGQLHKAAAHTGLSLAQVFLRTLASSCLGSAYSLLTSLIPAQKGLHSADPGENTNRQPILLVHGLYHNRWAWLFYRHWLPKAGFPNLYTWSYPSFGRDFHSLSHELAQEVTELAHTHPAHQVICIGHSLGGLLIKSVINTPETANHISLAVTLGTPHRGSVLASAAVGKLGRSLRYNGDLVRSLADRDKCSTTTKVSIFAPLDNMVAPACALHPQNPGWKEVQTPPVGHISLLFHRPTAKQVLACISEHAGPFSGPEQTSLPPSIHRSQGK
ncbi:esterase/lipase family protein [Desulfovermiculus halophilus]|uniref:esterase/lipase family protein n=1 Tax=Desulfovermiculus halophilus TaxID=339722 RepID=UPI00068746AE|nr:alpha/beta fold hydrolase [Desulfovermiculus halophilus]